MENTERKLARIVPSILEMEKTMVLTGAMAVDDKNKILHYIEGINQKKMKTFAYSIFFVSTLILNEATLNSSIDQH